MRCNVCCEFILRKTKALSLIHYITDYQTELSSKTYHRVAFAAGLRAKCPVQCDSDIFSESKRFLIQTFNKLATNREISAVEIAHVSLGYPEFYSNKTYRTISLTALYAAMKYKFVDMACKWGSGLLKSRLCFLTSKNHKQDYKQRGTTTWG